LLQKAPWAGSRQVEALAVPTAYNRNEKGENQDCQQGSVATGRGKIKGQSDLLLDEKTLMNDGKNHRKPITKINLEKP
jgi:hypothetical protein